MIETIVWWPVTLVIKEKETMRIIILEDTPERLIKFREKLIGHEVIDTKDTKKCIELLDTEPQFDYIFLDHDLTSVFEKPGIGTGFEVAKWISEHPDKCPTRIMIHSLNNVGAAAMMRVLGDAEIRATYVPWLWEKLEVNRMKSNESENGSSSD